MGPKSPSPLKIVPYMTTFSSSHQQNKSNDKTTITLTQSLQAGKKLLNKLAKSNQLLTPLEKESMPNLLEKNKNNNNKYSSFPKDNSTLSLTTPESSQETDITLDESAKVKIDETEILNTMQSLVTSLDLALKQIQQLKYKTMIQHDNDDAKSRIDVEKNLQRQEFERVKSQLLLEKNSLLNKVFSNDNKVKKYKKRIVEKNLEINRLAKLLNENVTDITYHDISSLDYSNSSVSSAMKTTNPTSASLMNQNLNKSKKTSSMLRTLGALASHVLKNNEDSDDNSVNRTLLLHTSKIEDENNTEAEISFLTNNHVSHLNDNSNVTGKTESILENHMADSTSTPTTKITRHTLLNKTNNLPMPSNTTDKDESQKLIPLPKMSSFNTINGSIKN
ncbi:protein Fdo1p [Monosporozyma servazzii]